MSFSQQFNSIIENFITKISQRYNINSAELRSIWNGDAKSVAPPSFPAPSSVPSLTPGLTPMAVPTPVTSRTTSVESSSGGCIYVLSKGANAGSVCGKKCAAGVANYCSAHKKYENQPPKAARNSPQRNVPPPVPSFIPSPVKAIIGKPIPGMPDDYLHNTETGIVFYNNIAIGKLQDGQVTYMDEKDKNSCRARSWTFDPEFLVTGKLSPPSLPTLAPPNLPNLPPPNLPPSLKPSLPSSLPPSLPPPPLPSSLPRTIPKPPNFTVKPPASLADLQNITMTALGVPQQENSEENLEEGLEENLEEENVEENLEENLEDENLEAAE